MGSIFISVPDFSNEELLLNEAETKAVLKFFFPESAARIDALPNSIPATRLAQTILVAGVDGTFALGFVEGIMTTYFKPGKSIQSALMKFAKKGVKHWFRHATSSHDLAKAQIAQSVKFSVRAAAKPRVEELFAGLLSSAGPLRLHTHFQGRGYMA